MLNAIIDMVNGYELFFKHKNLNNKPYFKNENKSVESYRPRNEIDCFYFEDNMVKIEGLKFKELIITNYHTGFKHSDKIKFINPIIFRNNYTNEYYLNFVLIKNKLDSYFIENNIPISEAIGIDLNKNNLYACSDGTIINSIDTSRIQKHISDIDRKIANDRIRYKDFPISNSAKQRLIFRMKLYNKASNIFKDNAYKGSLEIIRKRPEAIILESLEIKKIMSHHYIADDLQFYPLGIAENIIKEQAFKYNIPVIYAPLGFQSSNICSNCGHYKDIKSNKYFDCPVCNLHLNRDINAAINLKKWYYDNKLV